MNEEFYIEVTEYFEEEGIITKKETKKPISNTVEERLKIINDYKLLSQDNQLSQYIPFITGESMALVSEYKANGFALLTYIEIISHTTPTQERLSQELRKLRQLKVTKRTFDTEQPNAIYQLSYYRKSNKYTKETEEYLLNDTVSNRVLFYEKYFLDKHNLDFSDKYYFLKGDSPTLVRDNLEDDDIALLTLKIKRIKDN